MDRSLLKFSRAQESAADQAAFTYLDRLKWPATGLMEFFKILQNRSPLIMAYISKYALTHPLSLERIQACTAHINRKDSSGYAIPDSIERQFIHIKAKIEGFLLPTDTVLQKYTGSCPTSLYARAIAYYRKGKNLEALDSLSNLQKIEPNNPYYYELKGQILLEAGNVEEAIIALKTSYKLCPHSTLIAILLAQAYLESNKETASQEALNLLIPLSQKKDQPLFVWRLMAAAYGKQNQQPLAALCLAEEAFEKQEFSFSRIQAEKAKKGLPVGSKAHIRADDLIQQLVSNRKT